MNEKTCKDCLHCSIEDKNKVYCSGMPWHYPFGGSDTVSLNKKACEYFLERDKPTIFDQITDSPEVLAEEMVYCVQDDLESWWTSNILDKYYNSRSEAFDATVARLKEVIQ